MGEPHWTELHVPRPIEVSELATARTLRVPRELAGMRLDVFLAASLRSTSRTRAKLIARQAAFTVDGKRLRPNQRLKGEEHVVLWREPVDQATDVDIPVLFRDRHLLVVNKPAGVTVHPTASHYHNTVIRMLQARLPGQYLSLIHRLDRDTSGVLLLALTPEADRAFKMLLEGTLPIPAGADARIEKSYLAITWGVPSEGLIDLPVERDPLNPLRVKMRVAAPGRGLQAQTEVTVHAQEPVAGPAESDYALVECRLLTGRQHQIRLHLSATGTAIVGDRLYGPDERLHARGADGALTDDDWAKLEMPRQALHAYRYELPHALTWRRLQLCAPLPPDMRGFWQERTGRNAPVGIEPPGPPDPGTNAVR